MKRYQRVFAALLAGLLILNLAACHKDEEEPELPEEPVQDELPQVQPEVEVPQKEQAGLVDSNLMLSRLKENLEAPLYTEAHLREDSGVKINLTQELLNEIGGFLCQNFTVLRYTAAVDLSNCLHLQIIGQKEIHDVYVTQWTDTEKETHTFVQVEEEGMMGQYIYDQTTYPAMVELLESWEYENTMILSGDYQPLTSTEYLPDSGYRIKQMLQHENRLILELEGDALRGSRFDFIDTDTGNTIHSVTLPKRTLDMRSTDLDGYDFYFMTEDSVHYRSADDFSLKLDLGLPQIIKDKLLKELKEIGEPLFDVDYIQDLVVYISHDGVVLSNQTGKRNSLLLPHERLIKLLNLDSDEEKQSGEKEELTAYYTAPQLMNNGKLIVCPILLRGETDKWVGFSIFNLMNGTFKDYVEEFDTINSFSCPDEQTLLTMGKQRYKAMDVIAREFSEQEWTSATNESVFFCSMDRLLTWRKGMEYSNELLISALGTEGEQLLLTAQGDNFMVHGATKDYALVGWSDSQGDVMAVVDYSSKVPLV